MKNLMYNNMKNKKLLFSLCSVALVSLVCIALFSAKKDKKGDFKLRTFDNEYSYGIKEAARWLYERRMDPATGEINWEAFNTAAKDVIKLRKYAEKDAVTDAITWTEMGPNNIGGRTRALMIDKDYSNVIYAGGVAGGLFKTKSSGTVWSRLNLYTINGSDTSANNNMAISCLAQDPNGYIYVGTGEGLVNGGISSSNINLHTVGMSGDGIYYANHNGMDFYKIPNSDNFQWVNRIAPAPANIGDSARMYIATEKGLRILNRVGDHFYWRTPKVVTGTSVGLDVKVGSDGTILYSDRINSSGKGRVFVSTDNGNSFQKANGLPTDAGRIEIAIAPSDPNYMYVSLSDLSGEFIGVYYTSDKGSNWNQVIAKSATVNIFYNGYNNQGEFDNCIAVYPNDPKHFLVGGICLWEGKLLSTENPISVSFRQIMSNSDAYSNYSTYIHSDLHNICFDKMSRYNNSGIILVGCDGGLFKSTNGGEKFTQMNKNYNVTQFYAVACSNDSLKVAGGTQDNGSLCITGTSAEIQRGTQISSGDGGHASFSIINTDVIFCSVYGGNVYRKADLEQIQSATGDNGWYNTDMKSIASGSISPFVTPLYNWEMIDDPNSLDSVIYVAPKNIVKDEVIQVKSERNNYPMTYLAPKNITQGDSVKFSDHVMNRFFVGLSNGVWMTTGALDFSATTPKWGKILSTTSPITCLTVSKDGNYLYASTGSVLYRVSGISQCISNDTTTWHATSPTKVTSFKKIWTAGAIITSISVDPQNSDRVLVSIGGTGSSQIYLSEDAATAESPTFTNKHGNLPQTPIYSSLIEMNHSNWAMIGNEYGVWFTKTLNAVTPTWVSINKGMNCNVPVFHLTQQLHNVQAALYTTTTQTGESASVYYPGTNNSGFIYAATHGIGIFRTNAFKVETPVGIKDNPKINTISTKLSLYPNPASSFTNLNFELAESQYIKANIYDMSGRLVKIVNIEAHQGNNTVHLNCDNLNTGTYIINLKSESLNLTSKLIITK